MNDAQLFTALTKCKKSELLELLKAAYHHLDDEARTKLFGQYGTTTTLTKKNKALLPEDVVADITTFQAASLRGDYYAPFMIDSKNFMDVPEETDDWFEKMAYYFEQCCQLSHDKHDEAAINGFEILFNLLDAIGDDEIVFADELGTWMLPGDTEAFALCYVQSATRFCQPDAFASAIMPTLKEDSYSSHCNKVYAKIKAHASPEQIAAVKKRAKQQNIRLTAA